MRILRSLLFVPGNNRRMINKILELNADAYILDLEDSVPITDKETARFFVKEAYKLLGSLDAEIYVRTNPMMTGLLEDDLKSIVYQGLDAVVLPKCQSKDEILKLEEMLKKLEEERVLEPIGIFPIIETATGVLNVNEILKASKRIVAVGFGAGDYLIDIGGNPLKISKESKEILFPRAFVAIAARAHNVPAIDTVFFGLLTDIQGLIADAKFARQLGFKGKFVIHPSHIQPINEVFSPSPSEIERAKKVKEAFEEAAKRGLGATTLEGRMIDVAFYKQAEETLKMAEIIEKRKQRKTSSP